MRINTTTGWRRFLQLAGPRMGQFILFGLLKFVLGVCVIVGVILAGLLTCCVGFIFLIIPYINDVVLLPISYIFRAFGVEFLEQFGDEYKIFPVTETGIEGSIDIE
jgi:hypothetical protein